MKTLRQRQISALKKTLNYVIREWEEGKEYHYWSVTDCPLCDEFNMLDGCGGCPLEIFGKYGITGCYILARREGYVKEEIFGTATVIPLQDIAGFLKSLLVSL